MITREQKEQIFKELLEALDLPDSSYERAINRYEDLGRWFNRDESFFKDNEVHIFPQGSFMLGTTIRPINEAEEYDLDLACKIRTGVTKQSHSQESLKGIIGEELKAYRIARNIKEDLVSKHRCWRLEYQDDISFHLDIVPCIPEEDSKQKLLLESMVKFGLEEFVAQSASKLSVAITDDRHESFKKVCDDWNISNPEGYGKWFEHRMRKYEEQVLMEKAQVDRVPIYKRKTPLQRCIQLLKRHRDQMFGDNESKPISIIITTLAARAYNGEKDIVSALNNILSTMGTHVNMNSPRVPNPVNPEEDFADRWGMLEYLHLNLERNFRNWLHQAQIDFAHITSTNDTKFIAEQAQLKFSLNINPGKLAQSIRVTTAEMATVSSKQHIIIEPPKPWKDGELES
ncbi:nucleotidyltransferase domain-containing protein [Paenibacillus lautus]|uniref:nucleotidyltransferase domain-containing protein n=1 Tax=Paenibacillus lautus TaxID=1401 RepID=UPI000FD7D589|nr:nucleotidyltransferase [Paenibacillus lautus]